MADHGDGHGNYRSAADSLKDAVADKGPQVVGDGAEDGAHGEQDHGRDIDLPVAVDVGELADQGHAAGVAQEVAGDYPGDLAEIVDAQTEVAHDAG